MILVCVRAVTTMSNYLQCERCEQTVSAINVKDNLALCDKCDMRRKWRYSGAGGRPVWRGDFDYGI